MRMLLRKEGSKEKNGKENCQEKGKEEIALPDFFIVKKA
jgi:hypothetical protein